MRRLIGLFLAALTTAAAGDNVDKMDAVREQLRAGHTEAAIGTLQQQLAKDPGAVGASILLAETLLAAERFDEADQATESALARNKSDAGLERVLGDLRFREGRIFDAEKAYKAAIRLDPRNARAIYGVSRVFDATSFRKKASEMLQVAHAIDPQDPVIANAFDEAAPRSPAVLARREAELAALRDAHSKEPGARQRDLERWIAVTKALDGKPAFEPAAPDRPYRLPLGRLMDGRRLTGGSLPIKIGGAKADLRFDTGAGGITLGSRFAERAGAKRLADGEISGIGNGPAMHGWIGYASAIQIGDLTLENCIVQVPDKGSTDDSGGLIGSEVFRRFLVKINFAGQSLDLDPLPGPAWDGRSLTNRYEGPELAGFSQMLKVHHYLLIPTLISQSTKAEQTRGLFLLDTGADLNMISSNLAPAIAKVHDSGDKVRGISGRVKNVYEADKIVLQFATFRQLNLDLTSFDLTGLSRGAGLEFSGIMGLPLIGMFASVTLDYRDGCVKFDYKR
ncbi:MAG TPA: aspartyl protease family protein [Bryobacteraceae bacterium]|nr:aspartyl protease family protein [Bryobacteraceae bacterium]